MRQINKAAEPVEFVLWKNSGDDNWSPSYRDLRPPQREIVHRSLVAEQLGLCCYCGRRIDVDDSHIEHFQPQRRFGIRALDYDNLHSSCIRDRMPRMPLHCGHAKDDSYDELLAISPLDPACEGRFAYMANGAIAPRDNRDEGAAYMIRLLQLDIPFLRSKRHESLGIFDETFLAEATEADLMAIVDGYGAPDHDGRLPEFAHVVVAVARGLLKN